MAPPKSSNGDTWPPASGGTQTASNSNSSSAGQSAGGGGSGGGAGGGSGSGDAGSGGASREAKKPNLDAKPGESNHTLPDKVSHVRCGKELTNPEPDAGDIYQEVFNHIHPVFQGECLIRLAEETGWYWETLWNLPENKDLKEVRKNPNVLFPRDRVWIPKPRKREESAATEKKHTFKVKNRPSVVRLRVAAEGEPLANKPYTLEVETELFEGTTDGDGQIEHVVSPRARAGHLVVGEEPEQYEYFLQIGDMDPVHTVPGVKARLNNMGYGAGPLVGYGETTYRTTHTFRRALLRFQNDHAVRPTGIVCEKTIEALLKCGI